MCLWLHVKTSSGNIYCVLFRVIFFQFKFIFIVFDISQDVSLEKLWPGEDANYGDDLPPRKQKPDILS